MAIVLFEDEGVAKLDPVAVGKPAFAISCGGYRLFDILGQLEGPVHARVRPHLGAIVAADFAQFAGEAAETSGPVLWVNARLVPSAASLARLREIISAARPGIVQSAAGVSAALLPAGT